MNFNQLKALIKGSIVISASALFFISCNNDQSANNSTPGTSETDTTAITNTTPVVTKKKSGKVSSTMAADDAKTKMEKDKMGYYNRTEVLPAFNGGQTAMENYIVNTIEYPQDAIDNNAEGVVNVQFGVDEDGNISNVIYCRQ